jgi:protein-S-isoprenylcysteine O-methyltransferase Ste14
MNNYSNLPSKPPKSAPTKFEIFLSLLWPALLLSVFLVIFISISLRLDQLLNLPKPFPEALNEFFALIIWLIFSPIYLGAAYQLITQGKGSPNPVQASPTQLVTGGIYGIIRHPMNLSYPFFALAIGIYLNSLSFLILTVPIVTYLSFYHALVIQDKHLAKEYGQAYLEYKQKVPAFIPKFPLKKIKHI